MTIRQLAAFSLTPLFVLVQVLLYLLFPEGYPLFWRYALGVTLVLVAVLGVSGFVGAFLWAIGTSLYDWLGWRERDDQEAQVRAEEERERKFLAAQVQRLVDEAHAKAARTPGVFTVDPKGVITKPTREERATWINRDPNDTDVFP